ncbi:MAG: ThuA domain-containing protein [Gemmatimonadota bacterium]
MLDPTGARTYRPRLVLLSGRFEGPVEDTTGILHDYLAERVPVEQEVVQWPAPGEPVSLAAVDEADVVLVFADGVAAEPAGLERLRSWCAGGGSVVAVRAVGAAFRGWPEFEAEVLGGRVEAGDAALESFAVDFAADGETHPLLQGMEPFEGFGPPVVAHLAADAEVVCVAPSAAGSAPVAWTRQRGRARHFATTLGSPRDFWEYDFLRLVENAVAWAARLI